MSALKSRPHLESGEPASLEDTKVLQSLINSGRVWELEGSVGRSAIDAIDAGRNMLARYWRIHHDIVVPGRDHVQEGSKGSYVI